MRNDTAVAVNQAAAAGTWVSLGSFAFSEAGTGQQVRLTDQATGTVVADAVKLVRDNSGETDTEGKTFTHAYDANGNLTSLTDGSSGALVDQYVVGYDGLNRVSSVQEKTGSTVKATTAYTYDPNGNPLTRGHDDQDAAYTWDTRDLLSTVAVTEPGAAAKTTTYTYTPNGWVSRETRANGNTVDHTHFLDGLLRSQVEKKASGTLVAEHVLAYNGNGHKTSDTSRVMDADNHATYLDVTTAYTYDPRDRIASVTKTDTSSGGSLSTESYTHDANGNVIAQTIAGVATSFVYDRNRLLSSTSGGVASGFNYDSFGRLDTVTAAGQVLQSYRYDGFDRVLRHTSTESGSTQTTTYAYDPMDRTASRTANAGTASAETTTFAYLGLSDQLVTEQIGGQLERSYQYSPWGQRLSQVKHDTGGQSEDSFYGYTPHTDVETLTTTSGDTRATYGYTAFGSDDLDGFTGVDKPDPVNPDAEPYNLYRYTGKRWDPVSGDYDMGFRDYNPGLNRFLSRDMYTGALADLNLATSPWTGNRYAFTGGNPITGIEYDGHAYDSGGAGYNCQTYTCPGDPTYGLTDPVPSTPPGSDGSSEGTPVDGGGTYYTVQQFSERFYGTHWSNLSPLEQQTVVAESVCMAFGECGEGLSVHDLLDALGLLPFIGEPADVLNGIIYAAQGDAANAGISLSSALPVAGTAITGAKWGRRAFDAAGAAGGSARFIVNSAGDILDTARITIPEGKFGYLLGSASKSGVFKNSMGFDTASLDSALRGHLVANFGKASPSAPMIGGGTKFSVRGPLTGPSGQTWNITTAWGIDPNGTIRLITATP